MSGDNADDHEHVYTDGACSNNQNRNLAVGGIGVFFGRNDPRNTSVRLPGAEQTNNRAEMMAAIMALEKSDKSKVLHLYTDSVIVYSGITLWINNWRSNGWKNAAGQPVKNKDLWLDLDDLVSTRCRPVIFRKVKGHSTDYGNEQADMLARQATKGEKNGK
jgi:ribonuclease HI